MSDHTALAPTQLIAFLNRHRIDATILAPGIPMPTVPAAAAAIGVPTDRILKTILFASDGAYVVAIASGTARIDRDLLAKASGLIRPRMASSETVLAVTGYPAGGVAPVGLPDGLPVVVDAATAALPVAYGGAGREDLLLQIPIADVIRLNRATVQSIVAPA